MQAGSRRSRRCSCPCQPARHAARLLCWLLRLLLVVVRLLRLPLRGLPRDAGARAAGLLLRTQRLHLRQVGCQVLCRLWRPCRRQRWRCHRLHVWRLLLFLLLLLHGLRQRRRLLLLLLLLLALLLAALLIRSAVGLLVALLVVGLCSIQGCVVGGACRGAGRGGPRVGARHTPSRAALIIAAPLAGPLARPPAWPRRPCGCVRHTATSLPRTRTAPRHASPAHLPCLLRRRQRRRGSRSSPSEGIHAVCLACSLAHTWRQS
jgi:hypothetical protein